MVFEIREIDLWWWARCGLRPTADKRPPWQHHFVLKPTGEIQTNCFLLGVEDEDNGARKSCFQFMEVKMCEWEVVEN